MRKSILVFMLCALVLLCACGRASSSEVQTHIEAPSSTSTAGESEIQGVITDATMNTMQIQADDGTLYSFSTMDAEIDAGEAGILLGDTVVIHYTGELDENQEMQQVTVVKVTLVKQAEGELDGVVTDATMNTLTVKDGQNYEYIFSTQDADIEAGADGLLVGDTVTVTYTGVLDSAAQGAQTVTVTKVVVVVAEPENELDGVVTDASMNTIQVKNSHGVEYFFSTEGAEVKPGPNGLIVGDTVRLYFKGQLDRTLQVQQVTVDKIEVVAEPQKAPAPAPAPSSQPASSSSTPASSSSKPASSSSQASSSSAPPTDTTEHMISGTATDASMNTLQLQSNGVSYVFSTQGAALMQGSEGMEVGDAVAVYYTGALTASGTQNVTVTRMAITGWNGSHVQGYVTANDGSNLSVEISPGTTVTFTGGAVDLSDFSAGDFVTVYYFGNLDTASSGNQNVNLHSVEHTADPNPNAGIRQTGPGPAMAPTPAADPSVSVAA